VSLEELFNVMGQYPLLIVTVILILGVLFVNGWSDAPNAISTCISTKTMRVTPALIMGAVMNFIGLMFMFYISTSVAQTIQKMMSFNSGGDPYNLTIEQSLLALKIISASMISVIIFGVVCSLFGIPSSQTHSLIGGLVGAGLSAITLGHSDISINWGFGFTDPLGKVFYGLILSCVFGFIAGFLFVKLLEFLCRKLNRNHTRPFFKWAQIISGGSLAFVHGAQDGMQFVGVCFLAVQIAANLNGTPVNSDFFSANNLWYVGLICSLAIGVGTMCGGKKIIKKVAMEMTPLEPYQAFATDFSSAVGIFIATFFGFPISTSQVKAFSIIGVGATKGVKHVEWRTVGEMCLTWIITFPGCGIIAYLFGLLLIVL